MRIIIRHADGTVEEISASDAEVELVVDDKTYSVSEDLKRLVVRAPARPLSIEPLANNAIRLRAS